MRCRALDDSGDWTFGKGQNDYYRNQLAVAQMIQTRLSEILGDCFFDEGSGIDWFNLIGSKDQLTLELSISTVILNTDGVTGLLNLRTRLVGRQFIVEYLVQTVYSRRPLSSIFTFEI